MKKIFYTAPLCAAMLFTAQQAEAQLFEEQDTPFVGMHRTTPSVVDYNNDGHDDVFYGGATWLLEPEYPSWSAMGFLYTGLGNGEFQMQVSRLDDEEGEFRALGLPPVYWNTTRWFDFDNDGQVDFLSGGLSDCGLQLGEAPDYQYMLLFRNEGPAAGHHFSLVPATGICQSVDGRNDNSRNASFFALGDYDKDGRTDLVMVGERQWMDGEDTRWERYVMLYRNMGDGTFQEQRVFTPLPYDENPSPENLFEIDEETFETTPTMRAKGVSNGAVRFADLDNDGWLDIVYTGWRDGTNGGPCFYIYRNQHDGTFQEVDLQGQDFVGVYESDLALADLNNDGWLDIISTGTPNEGNKRADVYLNAGDGELNFVRSDVDGGNGLYGVSAGVITPVDLNHDGLTDLIFSGWTNVNDLGWGTYVFLQNADNTFTREVQTGLPTFDSGSYALGDFYGRNTLDVFGISAGWNGEWQLLCKVYKSTYDDNTPPTAPADVAASYADGTLTVTWTAATDEQCEAEALAYNVFVRNVDTGWMAQLLPASTATGHLQTYRDVQTLVRGAEETLQYQLHVPDANYEVGVQAVDPSGIGGPYATTRVASAISTVKADGAAAGAQSFDLLGRQLPQGGQHHGITLVRQGQQVHKVVR